MECFKARFGCSPAFISTFRCVGGDLRVSPSPRFGPEGIALIPVAGLELDPARVCLSLVRIRPGEAKKRF